MKVISQTKVTWQEQSTNALKMAERGGWVGKEKEEITAKQRKTVEGQRQVRGTEGPNGMCESSIRDSLLRSSKCGMTADGRNTEQNEVCSEVHSVLQFSYEPTKCTALRFTREDISRRQVEIQVCYLGSSHGLDMQVK